MFNTTTTSSLEVRPETGPDTRRGQVRAADNAPGAGSEQRDTEHVDPAATGSARARTDQDIKRAHQLASPGRRGAQGPVGPKRAPTPWLAVANSSPAAPGHTTPAH
jgi:hypothetical protein